MGGIFNGFVKSIFILLALGFGCVFVIKNFLNPPQATIPPAQQTQPVAAPPANNQQNPTKQTSQTNQNQSQPTNSSGTNSSTPVSDPSSNDDPELVADTNNIPTVEQPEEKVLEIPEKLEPGAELKVYINNDDAKKPNPASYSPSKIARTENISLQAKEETDIFQESSGYFKVEKSGEYNVVVEAPGKSYYYDKGNLVTKIDQEPLKDFRGGRIALDKGWHKLDLFYNPSGYAKKVDESQIKVKMGTPGNLAKNIDIWRPVESEETSQNPN